MYTAFDAESDYDNPGARRDTRFKLLVHFCANFPPFAICVRSNDSTCLLYTSPSPRDRTRSRMPSSA